MTKPNTPDQTGRISNAKGGSQPTATKSLPDMSYLKTWVTRTRGDVVAIPQAPALVDDVLNNLDELEKYLENLQ